MNKVTSGVYIIENKINGHGYIGSSLILTKRWEYHRQSLRKKTHYNSYLQNAWNKYGEVSFVFRPLLYCGKEMLIEFEQRAMDVLGPEYNIAPVAGNCLGRKHTKQAKAKMSMLMMGNQRSLGHRCSPEKRSKISAGMIGNKNSLGYKHSAETRAEVAKAMMGNKNSLGNKHTAETKAKISNSQKARNKRKDAYYVQDKILAS